MKEIIASLKKDIKELAARAAGFNVLIHAASGPDRHQLRVEKGWVGCDARYALLAYAFLKGRPYRALEGVCKEDADGSARKFLVGQVRKALSSRGSEFADNDIISWMDVPAAEAGRCAA